MIVCSCNAITSSDIGGAVSILNAPEPQILTPGLVYRQLGKKMVCCGCTRLPSRPSTRMEELERNGPVVCPYRCAAARVRLRAQQSATRGQPQAACRCEGGSCDADARAGDVEG
jgi:hypothetical protein